jgi:hypothetical protein
MDGNDLHPSNFFPPTTIAGPKNFNNVKRKTTHISVTAAANANAATQGAIHPSGVGFKLGPLLRGFQLVARS